MAPNKKHKGSAQSLENLYQQKNTILTNVARIRRSIKEKTISFNQNELQCRLEILNSYIEDAMEIQSEIDILDPSNNERSDLENLCVSTKSMLLGYLTPNREHSFGETTFGFQGHHSRLPNMKLPKFSGKYSEYKNFISLFESLVDNDHTLTEIEKFNHLISCLSDEALGTVKAYQISDQNYSKALLSLKKVYDNPCLIFFDNITKLFSLPEMSKPSASALRSMIDTVSAIYGSLLSIGDDKAITNAVIIHLVMTKVDPITRSKWEEQINYENLPLWSDCEAALNKRYQHISAEEASKSRFKSNVDFTKKIDNFSRKKSKSSFSCQTETQQPIYKCLCCKSTQHFVSTCPSFSAMPVQQRFDFIKGIPACINCLKKGHTVTKCKSSKCRVCSRSHNTLLHIYSANNSQSENVSGFDPNQPSTSRAFVNHSTSNKDHVILATALVQIKDKTGQYVPARALLDSGSQINFVTEKLARRLQLRKEERILSLVGIGKTNSSAKFKLQATVKSRMNSHEFSSEFWVLRSISNYQPDEVISTVDWNLPENIQLADPYFFKPQKIDMLIGAEIFFELLCIGQIRLNPNTPTLQKTLLGWIVSGKYKGSKSSVESCHLSALKEDESSLESIVQKFWELEEVARKDKVLSTDHQYCEEHFIKSIRRVPSGRFEVSLPFKGDPKTLGLSFETAKRRFLSLERRLSKEPHTKEMYNSFMKEYISLGHMSIAENKVPDFPHYFIPHQCVLRPQSSTTKLRVVFDASCKTSTQLSLNDLLLIGPTVQEELYSTLIRFRLHKYAITADIEKMYRQVLIDEADRNFQFVLWREHQSQNIEMYRLNTVTYGTSSAPFLAIRCLTYLSDLFEKTFPIGSNVIRSDFYVDDLLTGADSIEELEVIRVQVTEILQSAGFNLAKWFSNHENGADLSTTEKPVQIDPDCTKTLGTYWRPKRDVFKYHLDDSFQNLRATKRNILSVSARLFDPLGLLCPLVVKAKVLLQELWLMKLDWDESIPISLNTSWENFKSNLLKIDAIEIPRYVLTTSRTKCQIHGFSDASMRAYGCCIYIRSRVADKTFCRLLTAKSKVAPLKTKSLPRLELCAAHLLAKLWSRIKPMISCIIEDVIFWTDSEITLHWIRTHSSALAVFVSNRVAEIQELSDRVTWRHVPTKENPADIVSRGCNVDELINSIWFNGPKFLLEESNAWPVNKHFTLTAEEELLEKKKMNVFFALEEVDKEINYIVKVVKGYSVYSRLIRVFTYVFRFIDIARGNRCRYLGAPTPKEMNWTFLQLIEFRQNIDYREELKKLVKSQALPSSLQRLNPFVHQFKEEHRSFSLIRVGGRLLNAPIAYDAKFPLLMSKKSHFMTLYLRHLHIRNCHAGAKALVALLRDRIWLINAREECTKTVRKCLHCFRYKPKLMGQIMGNLPADRVRALRPFKVCGVDFCGPVNVTQKIRGRPPVRMYIAVFVCFTSKAVHIELVTDLTSNSFILCLQRFIGRRGLPERVYCDNATNFVGANRELMELQNAMFTHATEVVSYAANKGVSFNFIPPRAPHFGGLWEAAVKSAKGLVIKTVGKVLLTTEELQTVLIEVEAVLNSRPIAPVSNDPNDGEALTPGHLLIGESLRTLPPGLPQEEPASLIYSKRWRLISTLKRMFWQSWERDYVRSLQTRTKWAEEEPDLDVGKLVIVHEDNLPPLQWLTGRVQSVLRGRDGKVRVAEVKTKNGVMKRPIHKLALLPID